MNEIAVYVEGLTEWYAIKKLHYIGIFNRSEIFKGDLDSVAVNKTFKKSRSEMKQLLSNPNRFPPCKGIMLVFDQENDNEPKDTANDIFGIDFHYDSVGGHSNLFIGNLRNGTKVVLHVATAESPDENKDFDGYILQLIDRLGDEAVNIWLKEYAPGYLKDQYGKNGDIPIHALGREKIPVLMNRSRWRILRSKTLLYSYIAALQADTSHVSFSQKIIKYTPSDILEDVFADLIAGWNLLTEGTRNET